MHFNILIFIVQITFNQIKNANIKYFCFLKKGYVTAPFFKKNFLNINNMAKQTTTQISQKRETEQSQQLTTRFQTLKELPTPLSEFQCVLHKDELFICGGANTRACYSYHMFKNEYKFICEYPRDVKLWGYCVVKLVDSNSNKDKDNNQITLLSFGSDWDGEYKHTLVMKYVT
ncbi:hypothetical protein RFI_02202, partial [Reticulomyxa filosa]